MNVLFIDTSDSKEIKVGLKIDGKKYFKKKKMEKAQIVLSMIENILEEHELNIRSIDMIEVATGPGSFTGLRVGVSIANTLGAFLNIPINGQKTGKLAQPVYG